MGFWLSYRHGRLPFPIEIRVLKALALGVSSAAAFESADVVIHWNPYAEGMANVTPVVNVDDNIRVSVGRMSAHGVAIVVRKTEGAPENDGFRRFALKEWKSS